MRVILFSIWFSLSLVATAQDRPDQKDLDEVTRLGHMLYGYDQAAWHGTDAVMPLMERDSVPLDGSGAVRGYVAEPVGTGWRVGFGRLNPDSTSFLVAYEAFLDSTHTVTGVKEYSKADSRKGFYRDAILGLEAVRSRFPFQDMGYNFPVLPAPDGKLYVYVLPAQPDHNVYYVGGDARYIFDPETGEMQETKLHASIMTMDLRDDPAAVTFASAVLTEIPTETDIFYVLSRPHPEGTMAPHYVMTDPWVFIIGQDGSILPMRKEVFVSLGNGGAEQGEAADEN